MYKQLSTLSIAAMMLIGQAQIQTATAQNATASPTKVKGITMVKPSHAKPIDRLSTIESANASKLTPEQRLKFQRMKKASRLHSNTTISMPSQSAAINKAPHRASETASLWESFEDFVEDESADDWLPEGWSRQRTNDEMGISEAWIAGESLYDNASDGYNVMGITYTQEEKDEWLITPEVTVEENQVFSFYVYTSPMYMFNMDDDHVDWDAYEFISKEKAAAMDVRIQVEGGEWTVIKDFFDDYKDMSLEELEYADFNGMMKVSLPLTDYVGKKVRFGFCYQGADGDSWFIDAVSVDLPQLEVDYMTPMNEQFLGFGCDADFSYLEGTSLALYPANSDITWTNTISDEAATYTWTYDAPDAERATVVSESADELTLQYHPYYGNDDASRQNFYTVPTLTASAPAASDASYSETVSTFKVGGKAEYSDDGETYTSYGLIPFDINTEGMSYATAESPDGETADVPMFGYSDKTLEYWTYFTFSGDNAEGDKTELLGYLNYIIPGDQPMVVDKVWTNAIGRITDDAVLKASFYALNEDNSVPDAPFVTATCKGSDALVTEGYSRDYLTIPFTFSEPVVLEASDEVPGYLVEISGFNEGGVEYYAPIQSNYPNKDQKCYGFIHRETTWNGETHQSFAGLYYFENENGTMNSSFAINLGGYYPWLTSDIESLAIGDGETKTVALDSYYDGSELNVTCADGTELPAWLKAEVTGQYNKAVLTLTASETGEADEAEVLVSAAGVKQTVKVNKVAGSAINSATSNATKAVKSVYNLNGQRVSSNFVPAGLYIELDADGKAHKVVR